MKRIIIDTNFLLVPYKFRVDIFSEFNRICNFKYKIYIFEQTINELRSIVENQSGKDKKAAQFALKLIILKSIGIIKSEQKNADLSILSSINKDTIVATQDKQLKKELLKRSASLIILRQKKYLDFVGASHYKSFKEY